MKAPRRLAVVRWVECTRFAQRCPYCLREHGDHTVAQTADCEDAIDVNEARNRARDRDMMAAPVAVDAAEGAP